MSRIRSALTAATSTLFLLGLTACSSGPEPAFLVAAPVADAAPRAFATPRLSIPERWNLPTEPFQIADGIYYVGTAGLGSFLFPTPEGHILLDGALPASAPLIEANIRKLGFRVEDVKFLLNSHAHFDHSGGLAQLKIDTGAQLVAMDGDVSALESGTYLGSENDLSMAAPPVKVDRIVRDGNKVTLGGRTLVANLTPGHSRGCTSWSTTTEIGGQTLGVVVFCSATVAANRLVAPPQYEGIVEDYRATFQRARELKADIPLAPHPEFFSLLEKRDRAASGEASPFVDPTALGALIDRLEKDFDRLLAQQEAAAREKGSQ